MLLSVCLNVISASFDYVYEERSFLGKKAFCTSDLHEVHLKTSGLCEIWLYLFSIQILNVSSSSFFLFSVFLSLRPGGCAECGNPSGGSSAPSTGRNAGTTVLLRGA